jgi:tetratricopeptide (TPR) repeat protein
MRAIPQSPLQEGGVASIFLSYARGDAAKAERIAQLLANQGHSVWWDRNLQAGSRFTAEIDQALRNADAVVVLWSTQSVSSAWVQDEAAVGRDSSHLVPVLLEQVAPPLGFRQFQSVDFSGWSGRGRPRELKQLFDGVSSLGETTQPSVRSAPAVASIVKGRKSLLLVGSLSLLLLALAAVYFLMRSPGSALTLAVVPATSGDPEASRNLAHQVALDLTRFRSTYLQSLSVDEAGRAADYRAEVGVTRDGPRETADLSLSMNGGAGTVWADSIEGQSGHLVDLRQQAAAKLSAVMRCALEAKGSPAKLSHEDLRLYLGGCTAISTDFWEANAAELVPVFKKLTKSNPDFAPAQAMLALADINAFPSTPPPQWKSLAADARAALAKAKSLDPNAEDVIATDAQFHPSDPGQWDHAFPIIERGLAIHPNSPLLLSLRSQWLMSVGRSREAAATARQALDFDPLSPQMRVKLVDALTYSDKVDSAREELAKAEAIWPNASILRDARYRIELRYGDPQQALQLRTAGAAGDLSGIQSDQSWRAFLAARTDPTPNKIEAALNSFRERYRKNPADIPGYIQALGTFGHVDEAFEVSRNPVTLDSMQAATDVLFRPHMRPIYSDPRFMDLAHRVGLLAYWRKSGMWPDLCSDPQLPYDCKTEAAKYR